MSLRLIAPTSPLKPRMMNKVNNKKLYQTARMCMFFVRKVRTCTCEAQVWNDDRTVCRDYCILCDPKVHSCKNFILKTGKMITKFNKKKM